MKPLRINLLAFDSVVMKSEIPVLLVFGAIWDNKSRRLFDSLDRFAEEYDKKVKFGKVDYDYFPDIFHATISSSAVPSCFQLQSSPESGSFQASQLFASGGQSIGVPASA